jgi:RNase P subunit RPR2
MTRKMVENKDLDQREAMYKEQLIKVTKELDEATANLANVGTPQEFEMASQERNQVLQKHQNVLAGLAAVQHARTVRDVNRKAEERIGNREKVDEVLEWASKTRFLCPSCESTLVFDGPRMRHGGILGASDWKEAGAPYVLRLVCKPCNTFYLRGVEELRELEKASKTKLEDQRRR